jgi:hypothetical protein
MVDTVWQKNQTKLLKQAKDILAKATDDAAALKNMNSDMKAALKAEYGYAFALIMSDASLTKLFTKAVTTGMTPQGFQQGLESTQWFKSRNASQRKYDTLNLDPTAKEDMAKLRADVSRAIREEAVNLNGMQLSDEQVNSQVDKILRNNFDDWQNVVKRVVGDVFVNDNVFEFGGSAASDMTKIRAHAKSMGVYLDDATIGRYVDGIYSQKDSLENVINSISNIAVSYYPQFADDVKAGATIADISRKYTETAAQMLEVDPNDFDFFGNDPAKSDPLMAKAMFGGKDGKAMSVYDFRKAVKQDGRWKKTKNAREEYAAITQNVLKSFGGNF